MSPWEEQMVKLVEWGLNNQPLLVMLLTSGLIVAGVCAFVHVRLLRAPEPPSDLGTLTPHR
jgi:hypothetical protein